MRNGLLAELIAEFVGTMIVLLFGAGSVAMMVLFGTGAPGEVVHADTPTSYWAGVWA